MANNNTSNGKILVVDDDKNICELLRLYIEKDGFQVVIANDGKRALEMFRAEQPDLIMLDIMLPELDGWQVCREIRKESQCPIIMLTAKGEVFDKVLGLELGADDYVVKPFDAKEVVARIKAVLRRVDPATEEIYRAGTLELNAVRHTVTAAGQPVTLTRKEYDLLRLLLQNPGMVFTRDQLLDRVWGYAFNGENRTVDVHIRTLRQKLGDAGECVETVRGLGYKLNARG